MFIGNSKINNLIIFDIFTEIIIILMDFENVTEGIEKTDKGFETALVIIFLIKSKKKVKR